jgi:hypothetical protein
VSIVRTDPTPYPNGERKRDDVPDLSNNVRVDYSIFGTTYTV